MQRMIVALKRHKSSRRKTATHHTVCLYLPGLTLLFCLWEKHSKDRATFQDKTKHQPMSHSWITMQFVAKSLYFQTMYCKDVSDPLLLCPLDEKLQAIRSVWNKMNGRIADIFIEIVEMCVLHGSWSLDRPWTMKDNHEQLPHSVIQSKPYFI